MQGKSFDHKFLTQISDKHISQRTHIILSSILHIIYKLVVVRMFCRTKKAQANDILLIS